MARTQRWAVLATLALLATAGCGAPSTGPGGSVPSASPSDIPGRIMSLTGTAFTICGVNGDAVPYLVTVCGDLAAGRAALDQHFPGQTSAVAYTAGDGGAHTPQELVLKYWVDRASGDGFTVVSTLITGDGTISVGVDGDLDRARAVLDQRFPGKTRIHAAKPIIGGPLVVTSSPTSSPPSSPT